MFKADAITQRQCTCFSLLLFNIFLLNQILDEHSLSYLALCLYVAAQPQSVGLIAGTIATGVLAVIICSLLVVVSLFYWKNKNKYDEEEIPNEIRFDKWLCFSFFPILLETIKMLSSLTAVFNV